MDDLGKKNPPFKGNTQLVRIQKFLIWGPFFVGLGVFLADSFLHEFLGLLFDIFLC